MTVLENWKESLSSEDVNRFILFGLECQDCPAANHCDYLVKDNGKKLCEDHEAFQSFLDGNAEMIENDIKPLIDTTKIVSADKKIKRNWENRFQRWSNKEALSAEYGNSYGVCGYGSMCDYCTDNSYGRPCIRALNEMLREKRKSINYENALFEDIWEGNL